MELYNRRLLLINEHEPSPLSTSLFVTPLKLTSPVPFNSDVAYVIIIILLLIAFFVLFLRRYSHHSPSPGSSNHHSPSSSCGGGGLDPTTVQSLPVFPYNPEAKNMDDCPICLTEFETGETVKMVPNCKHVFHLECIDTWLSSHVTCPVCRGSEFFAVDRPEAESDKVALTGQRVASTVEDGATCHQRRSWSCSSFDRDTVVLRRTLSY